MIYYGYKRGDDDKIVDWSSVTKSLTDRLDEVEAKRAANRERIEGEIADASQKIGDVPMGNYENMNSFMIQTSTDMAENLRVNSALLRAGKMKSSEFAKFRQNSLDAIGQYKKIAENYNSLRDKGVARLNEGKSGWQEAYELERLEKLADLTRTVSVQDPITGTMFNAPIGEDGRPDMSQAESTLYLANMPFVEMDKFDMNAQLDPTVEKYGKNVEVIKSLGVNTKSSIKIRKDFEDSVNTFVGSFDSRQLASVLGDFIGGYKGTTDEDLAKSKPEEYILIGRDGSNGNFPTYKLTPEQETKAREAIKEQLYMKLDYVETPMASQSSRSSSTQERRQKDIEAAKANANRLVELFSGDDTKKSEVLATYSDQLRKNYKGFRSARIEDDKLIITHEDKDGKKFEEPIEMPDNIEDFITTIGPKLTGNNNLVSLYDEAVSDIDLAGVYKQQGVGEYKVEEVEDPYQALAEWSVLEPTLTKELKDWYVGGEVLGRTEANAKEVVEEYIVNSGVKGVTTDVVDNTLIISLDGLGQVEVDLSTGTGRKENLKQALRKIHKAAISGEPLPDTATGDEEEKLRASLKASGMTDEEIEEIINAD